MCSARSITTWVRWPSSPGILRSPSTARSSLPRRSRRAHRLCPRRHRRRCSSDGRICAQAARGIDAAAANLGSAQADLLPKFTLSFAGSVDRLDFGGLPTVTDNLFNVGLGIFWPLFNAGRIHANITAQDAALRQAEYAFDQALLNALQDVESAYTDVRAQRQRSALLGLAVESAQRSAKLAQDLYNAGQTDFLSVLDTHTQLLDTQRDLAQAQTDAAVSAVSLYRALGGAWRNSVATASVSPINTSAQLSAATP